MPDDEYYALVELRKKQGRKQMETYKPPLVEGCGTPAEQRKKRRKWKMILGLRNYQLLRRELKFKHF